MARNAMATATDRDREIGFAGERDGSGDVVDVERPDDRRGTSVDHPVERRARGVVTRVLRIDDRTAVALGDRQKDSFS
jgi:hypothetical protein